MGNEGAAKMGKKDFEGSETLRPAGMWMLGSVIQMLEICVGNVLLLTDGAMQQSAMRRTAAKKTTFTHGPLGCERGVSP